MSELLSSFLSNIRSAASGTIIFTVIIAGLFAVYAGIALVATLTARDRVVAEFRRQVLQDLLDLFKRRPR